MPRISFKTVGCRLNQAETEMMKADCAAAGFLVVPFGAAADVCVINGCAVTAKAERDSFKLARAAKNKNSFSVLAGCVTAAAPQAVLQQCGADLILPMCEKRSLPAALAARGFSGTPAAAAPAPVPRERTRALIAAQFGCDFYCTYCIVPKCRGNPIGRPLEKIIEETQAWIARGCREITLTGVNLGAYQDQGRTLVAALQALEALPGLARFRLSSIEMTTVERDVIKFMARSRKLCRHLHIPLQSGDNQILRAMGRRYNTEEFLAFIEYAHAMVGDFIGWGTDIIAGFPGEDEESFARTTAFLERLPLCNLHVFEFSRRPGTPAAEMPGQAPPAVKRRRVAALIELGKRKKQEAAQKMIGCRAQVLVEKRHPPGWSEGWTGEYLRAHIEGDIPVNELVEILVTGAKDGVVYGAALPK